MATEGPVLPGSDVTGHFLVRCRPLPMGEAHVWYASTAVCDTPARRAYYRSLLNDAERARLERFAFDHLKLEYLVTRALCRSVLSCYVDVAPQDWRFVTNSYGRPEIAMAGLPVPLRFNLSNVRTLAVCVVTRAIDAGIDVESLERSRDFLAIAGHYFAPAELRALRALPEEEQPRRFFELWTLKESYVKARGMGLSLPLEQFSFLPEARPIQVAFDPRLGDVAEDWQFWLRPLGERHLIAVSLRRRQRPDWCVCLREIVPDRIPTWQEVP